MADWPENLTVGPIGEWPGPMRAPANRERAKFMRPGYWDHSFPNAKWIDRAPMPLSATLKDLDRELEHLKAKDVVLLVAIPPGRNYWRRDDKPRAGVKAEHPGVILSFEIPKLGKVSYPSDRYTRWEDNLRAIAVSLESLRLVERHGVVRHGQQYRGFLAIEARAAGAFTSDEAAFRYLAEAAEMILDPNLDATKAFDTGERRRITAKALFHAHPDHGGDREVFEKCLAAQKHLQNAGLL